MEDPEQGRKAAGHGAQGDESANTKSGASPSGKAKRRRRPPRGRKPAGAVAAQEPKPDGASSPDPSAPEKPKRKRRRGRRKFFVRDKARAAAIEGSAGTEAAASAISSGQGIASPAPTPTAAIAAVPPAQPGRRPRPPQGSEGLRDAPVYAALDLGTNNCRLLMAVPTRPGQFRVVDAFSRIVRLGEGLSASGRLSDEAMDRAVDALRICASKLRGRVVRRARLIATEACRSATNGAQFLARVKAETGLDLEIVDRETEARLAVSGCSSLVERDTPGAVLFDIGGGSSEIALIDIPDRRSPHLAHHIVSWTSLPVGVVSLAERFGGRDVTVEVFEAMVSDVAGMILAFEGRDALAHLLGHERFHLLGTSGTVTTLAGIFLNLERYDRRRVDGIWMHSDDVSGMTQRLLGWDFDARVANPCIGADRADLVLAGCAILEAIRRAWPSQRLRVADRGLREGILTELMARDNVWRRRKPNRGGSQMQ